MASNIRAGSAFPCFGSGLTGEIGRGGAYTIVDADGDEEEAVGFSLYLDPLVDAGLGQEPRKKVFIPVGADQSAAARLRKEGWITINALSVSDDGAAMGCTHRLIGAEAQPY